MAKVKQRRMVGKFFLSFNDKHELELQGRIIEELRDGLFLCQLYEWIMGDSSDQVLIKLDDMDRFKFYDTHDDWRYAAESQMKRERFRERDDSETSPVQ